jgi:hypothetical protein
MTMYRDRCVITIDFCTIYDNGNRCTNCLSNDINRTQLMSDGTCVLLNRFCLDIHPISKLCSSCNAGYSLF